MPRNHITHGFTGTRFYRVYTGMNKRTKYKSEVNYHLYGGRGIKLEWKSFEEFKYDMYDSYLLHCKEYGEKNTSIDRIDTNGNYCEENCRWATPKEQARNTRRNRLITIGNETKCVTEWAEIFKLNPAIVINKLHEGIPWRKIFGL